MPIESFESAVAKIQGFKATKMAIESFKAAKMAFGSFKAAERPIDGVEMHLLRFRATNEQRWR